MTLAPGCPRCASPVSEDAAGWHCLDHGRIVPLWRPATPGYESFAEYLARAKSMPSLLPWPLTPGWSVTDFGCVGGGDTDARATFRLWSRNLLDETFVYRRSAANAGTLGDYGNLNPPRTFGVEMVLEF